MSEIEISTCEFIKEVESAAREARRKGGEDPSGPLAMAYYALSLELRKLVHRHIRKGHCASCKEDETRRLGAGSIIGLDRPAAAFDSSAVTQ